MAVRRSRHDGHHNDVLHAALKSTILRRKVSRIFTPKGAQAHFHDTLSGNPGQANTVTFSKSFPMRPIFPRTVLGRLYTRSEHSCSKTLRTDCSFYDPFQSLLAGDWRSKSIL